MKFCWQESNVTKSYIILSIMRYTQLSRDKSSLRTTNTTTAVFGKLRLFLRNNKTVVSKSEIKRKEATRRKD